MEPDAKVFIHTNHKQILGAYVAKHCLLRNTEHRQQFSVEFITLDDYPLLLNKQGQKYLRKGLRTAWDKEDLQSFTLLRFLPPQLMNYRGRAVVIDPDVFALGDIYELLSMDMQDKAIMCRKINAGKDAAGYFASSVMLLDCEKLRHWKWEQLIDDLFSERIDYADLMGLQLEDKNTIGVLAEEWNSFDKLTEATKLLHTTRRITQPWKTGLAVDFSKQDKPPKAWKLLRKAHLVPSAHTSTGKQVLKVFRQFSSGKPDKYYKPHPDIQQEAFFFSMLSEGLQEGSIPGEIVSREIDFGHIRTDAPEKIKQYG